MTQRRILFGTFLLIITTLVSPFTFAQQKTGKTRSKTATFTFESYNAIGWLSGDGFVHGQMQSVNGFSKGAFYAGAGLGMDFYRVRSVPLFLDLRYRLGKGKNKWYAYGDGGYHFPADNESDVLYTGASEHHFEGGLFYDAGIGYQLGLTKKDALFFSAGFSEKWMSEDYVIIPFCPGPGFCDPYEESAEYRFRRISVKIGWKF